MKKGDRFSCKIEGISAEGVVQREDGEYFLCQNVKDGKYCGNKLDFDYSWCVCKGTAIDLDENRVTEFKIVSRVEFKLNEVQTEGEDVMAEAKVISIRDDVAKVFEKTEDAVVVSKYMRYEDLGVQGFMTELLLEQNKVSILEEAEKRQEEAEEKANKE